jgi:hypothetical protein
MQIQSVEEVQEAIVVAYMEVPIEILHGGADYNLP